MATDPQRELYKVKVLNEVGREAKSLVKTKVTGFLPMVGHKYNRKLMVLGRSVNGWIKGIYPHELIIDSVVDRFAHSVQRKAAGNDECPMRWVTRGAKKGYNTKRSAFWRTIRKVVESLGIADVQRPDWPSHLVWSNLYKVSPSAGGNPNKKLREVQRGGCIDLLRLELETYRPARVLLLTGAKWATPFDEIFDIKYSDGLSYVEKYGTCIMNNSHQFRCVIAVHPQSRPETAWVDEVVRAFDH